MSSAPSRIALKTHKEAMNGILRWPKLTLTWATIPVFEGEADVPNHALHFLAGLGYRF